MKKVAKTTKTKKVKKMTIEDLALMVVRGFESMATKDEMNARFDEAVKENKDRFDKIENILIRALDNRTTKLEDENRVIKTTLEKMSRV